MFNLFTLNPFEELYGVQPATGAATFTPEWSVEAGAPMWDTTANAEVASQN